MATASSQFLRNANSGLGVSLGSGTSGGISPGTSVNIRPPSDADVLNVAASPDVNDVQSMAIKLGTLPELVEPVFRKLSSDGFLEVTDHGVGLSAIGERALRYAKVAKY